MLFRFLTLLFLTISPLTWGQDSGKKLTLEEATAEYDSANKELNEVWAKVKETLSEEEFVPLQIEQRGWLQYREYVAAAAGDAEPGTVEYLSTAASHTHERVIWLKALMDDIGDSANISGFWMDSYGGSLEIVEEDGKLYFLLNVVRGPTLHLGQIAGIGLWNSPLGWFSDNGREESKTEETNLAFVKKDRILEITGANTKPYHGARAYFGGRYLKVAKVSVKEASRIIKAAEAGFEEP